MRLHRLILNMCRSLRLRTNQQQICTYTWFLSCGTKVHFIVIHSRVPDLLHY